MPPKSKKQTTPELHTRIAKLEEQVSELADNLARFAVDLFETRRALGETDAPATVEGN